MKESTIIIVAGGSASGKTTVAQEIANEILKGESVTHLSMDCYYKDFSDLKHEEKQQVNFDHPNSLDIDLLVKHLDMLKSGKSIQVPVYDFTKYSHLGKVIEMKPADVIILDGILALHIEEIRNKADVKLFIKTDDDIRFIRRLLRDVNQRGRTLQGVVDQYLKTVKPMHKFFVEPSIDYADLIIPYYEGNKIAIDVIATTIKAILDKKEVKSKK